MADNINESSYYNVVDMLVKTKKIITNCKKLTVAIRVLWKHINSAVQARNLGISELSESSMDAGQRMHEYITFRLVELLLPSLNF